MLMRIHAIFAMEDCCLLCLLLTRKENLHGATCKGARDALNAELQDALNAELQDALSLQMLSWMH